MKKTIIICAILVMLILPMITADINTPGYEPIKINNKVTNLEDYPNYIFVVVGEGPMEEYLKGEQLNYVKEDGSFETSYYKFSIVNVYAIKKSTFNEDVLRDMDKDELINYFNSSEVIRVLEKVNHYEERHISNPNRIENNFYEVSITETKYQPDKTENEMNFLIYFYVLVPLIALILILLIIKKRK